MGAFCGKPIDESQSTPPTNQPQHPHNPTSNQATIEPTLNANGNGNGTTAVTQTTHNDTHQANDPHQASTQIQPQYNPNAPSAAVVDDRDIQLQMNPSEPEPEFQHADVDKQASGEEAYSFWDRNKTFKPERQLPQGSKRSNLHHTMQATLRATLGGSSDLQNTVKLPEGEDLNEWLAVNTVHFFNAASMIYGTCSQFCTDQTCPTMAAGKAEYLWKDGNQYKKPTRVSAPVYIDLLLSWADERIQNPALFPVDINAKFPRTFLSEVKQIYKRLFRLYAHLYTQHSEKIRSIGANAHLNTCFKHFIYFVLEFGLMDPIEMQPLEKLINKLKEAKAKK